MTGNPTPGTDAPIHFRLTAEPLSMDALVALVTRPDCGAVAAFAGVVRGVTVAEERSTETEYLVYEAYALMAEKQSLALAAEVMRRWPQVRSIAMEHRTGRCEIGEPTVAVAVATPHRNDGCFEACRYAIDRLKAVVPIWKQENQGAQATWVEGEAQSALNVNP